ncbi:unnamed protein product, partial [Candidula unifasciata]
NRLSSATHDFLEGYTSYHLDEYVENILKHVDGLKKKLENGIQVLEIGCGRGRLLEKLALMFPKSTFTATENAEFLLDQLKANLGHIPNIKYAALDVCCPSTLQGQQYDWVFCINVIHDVPSPPNAYRNIKKFMKDQGGTFTMVDPASSGSPISDKGNLLVASLYAISSFFCVAESYINEHSHAMGMCYGEKRAVDFLTAAGFSVEVVRFDYPMALFVCK